LIAVVFAVAFFSWRFQPKIACQGPKTAKLPNRDPEVTQTKKLTRGKYIRAKWHFSYAPFDKIEVDRKSGPAKSRAFAF
jgi:hypothetical protein